MRASHPYALRMTWRRLCFMHWPVSAARLQAHLPAGLTLDTYQAQAYLGVVPFLMSDVAPRGVPALSRLSAFPELNLRTYVVDARGVPGVWFFSLDAAQPVAVRLARLGFHLPYFDAQMWTRHSGDLTEYASVRTHPGTPTGTVAGNFAAAYRPIGPVFEAQEGSLEAWLTERYFLFSAVGSRIYKGPIWHQPWALQRAEAEIRINTLPELIAVKVAGEPHLLYSEQQVVKAGLIARVR